MTDAPPPPAPTSKLTKTDRPQLANAGRLMTDQVQARFQANSGGMMSPAENKSPAPIPPLP